MEQSLVLKKTHTLAIRIHELLKDLDPARWSRTRKQNLKEKIQTLDSEVSSLYQKTSVKTTQRELKIKPAQNSIDSQLKQIGQLLTKMKDIPLEEELSYFKLYALRKRLTKSYQELALIMEAYEMPIPVIRPSNLKRSLFHMSSATFVLFLIQFTSSNFLVAIATVYAIFCFTMEIMKRLGPELNAKIMNIFAPIAHPHEYDKMNSATWYGVGLLLLSFLYSPVLGAIAVVILGFADPLAAMVGRKYGTIKLPGNRTLEGSFTFFIVGTIAAAFVLTYLQPIGNLSSTFLVAASAAFCGALGELAGKFPDDNLTIPMASVVGASLAMLFI